MPLLKRVIEFADKDEVESVLNFKALERIARNVKTDLKTYSYLAGAVEEWARDGDEQEEKMKEEMSPSQYKE